LIRLEKQFQNLILDLEARERKLDEGEEDLIRRRNDLEREFERRIEEDPRKDI
jgi:N-acetylmuramic acid 6-phosphate (MurNAc-6-P) etherase